jgi:hypothetical protein
MPPMPRQLAATAIAVLALGASPALASAGTSSTGAAMARTPLTAKIAAETPSITLRYQLSGSIELFEPNALASGRAAYSVNRVRADSAQFPAKLEWVLGAYVQARGDNSIYYGQHERAYHHPAAGERAIDGGVADFRLSNYLIGRADSLLGVRHPELSARPISSYYKDAPRPSASAVEPAKPPTSLAETIDMGIPVLDETIPATVQRAFLTLNEAACNYYLVAVAGAHADGAQRPAVTEWLSGVHAQLRGDELLGRGILEHQVGNPATGNREMMAALEALHQTDSAIAHADALLGVHSSRPSVRLPTHAVYYKG